MDQYQVFWPRGSRCAGSKHLAPRLQSLNGKLIAPLWNYIFRGDEIFALLEEELKARFPGLRFVNWREFGSIHGRNERDVIEALPERFRQLGVDAVITAIGA
jgi:hypothetical protein